MRLIKFYQLDPRGLDDLGMRNSLTKHIGVRPIVREKLFGKFDKPTLRIEAAVAAQDRPLTSIISRNL